MTSDPIAEARAELHENLSVPRYRGADALDAMPLADRLAQAYVNAADAIIKAHCNVAAQNVLYPDAFFRSEEAGFSSVWIEKVHAFFFQHFAEYF